jgi:hypothetical protein
MNIYLQSKNCLGIFQEWVKLFGDWSISFGYEPHIWTELLRESKYKQKSLRKFMYSITS